MSDETNPAQPAQPAPDASASPDPGAEVRIPPPPSGWPASAWTEYQTQRRQHAAMAAQLERTNAELAAARTAATEASRTAERGIAFARLEQTFPDVADPDVQAHLYDGWRRHAQDAGTEAKPLHTWLTDVAPSSKVYGAWLRRSEPPAAAAPPAASPAPPMPNPDAGTAAAPSSAPASGRMTTDRLHAMRRAGTLDRGAVEQFLADSGAKFTNAAIKEATIAGMLRRR